MCACSVRDFGQNRLAYIQSVKRLILTGRERREEKTNNLSRNRILRKRSCTENAHVTNQNIKRKNVENPWRGYHIKSFIKLGEGQKISALSVLETLKSTYDYYTLFIIRRKTIVTT